MIRCTKCGKAFNEKKMVKEEAFAFTMDSMDSDIIAQAGKHGEALRDGIYICWECFLEVLLRD